MFKELENRMMQIKKTFRKIYLGIILYVGIGTLSVCAIYPHDTLACGEWIVLPLLLTFPANIVSFGYRFFEAEILYPVFIIQAIVLLIWLGIAFLVRNHKIRRLQQIIK